MRTFVRLLPGLLGAIAGFVVLKLIGVLSLGVFLDLLIFVGVYLVVTLGVHQAMKAYGER